MQPKRLAANLVGVHPQIDPAEKLPGVLVQLEYEGKKVDIHPPLVVPKGRSQNDWEEYRTFAVVMDWLIPAMNYAKVACPKMERQEMFILLNREAVKLFTVGRRDDKMENEIFALFLKHHGAGVLGQLLDHK